MTFSKEYDDASVPNAKARAAEIAAQNSLIDSLDF